MLGSCCQVALSVAITVCTTVGISEGKARFFFFLTFLFAFCGTTGWATRKGLLGRMWPAGRHMNRPVLDPRGVQLRKRNRPRRFLYINPGPNFLWHVDSYDKLKPYGICINGAVDGFSRMVIWLHANTTSSNPRVISDYFLDEVEPVF